MENLPKHELVTQLLTAINYSIEEYLRDSGVQLNGNGEPPEYWSLCQAAKYCGVSRQTLYNWRVNKRIEFYKLADHPNVVRIADIKKLVRHEPLQQK